MPSSFCTDEEETRKLDATARSFLEHLGLPTSHPLCDDDGGLGETSEIVGAAGDSDHERVEELLSNIGAGVVFELPNAAANFFTDADANGRVASQQLFHRQQQQMPTPPSVGSISLLELHDHSAGELLLTAATMSAPTLAMSELWLRFFAAFLSPLCLCWMIHREVVTKNGKKTKQKSTAKKDGEEKVTMVICIAGLASSAVLFTDSLYVYEYGRWFGLSLFISSTILAVRCAAASSSNKEQRKNGGSNSEGTTTITLFRSTIFLLIATMAIVFLRSDGGMFMDNALRRFLPISSSTSTPDNESNNSLDRMPHPGIDLPTILEGMYLSSSNPLVSSIVSHWPESSRTYTVKNGATPYLVNGDQRTGIPFVVNGVEDQEYVRVWTRNGYDGEYLALDIAFPYSEGDDDDDDDGGGGGDDESTGKQTVFVHDPKMPVYLVLHGLNGGSHEEYVKDLVKRRRAEGSTVVVMIARGMMDTRIVGWNMFHGARTGDVDVAARAVRRGLISLHADDARSERRQILVGVGYSMGAIILSNYVARSGEHCALDAAMAISGGLDMRQQLNFKRSMRLWQPMLTFGLREDMLIGKYARHCKHRLTREKFFSMLRVTSISALDVEAIVSYNSFDNLVHYYSEMSAMGDRDPEFDLFGASTDSAPTRAGSNNWGRIANVSIPFAVLQALDDPLVGWRTVGTNDPQGLVESGSGNIMLVLTKAGGHVGWPLGNNPKKDAWKWMNNAARDFALAVDMAKKSA
mmetsp:Transcript_12915/g.31476  ORF Transcript_12915/g.31476 Transcript_12915/m.31476 type:complete len:748 (+) Transcript_12915:205-2448(+)|eukprot:CAMPEP_0181103490 /NCGR_PEP_ID=MMETSP1071-20121207/14893_1 /TAXON_ID=35127 /ORGANISM="Thalassiosira sp., Strain NH16" /LENGTH=747 /DNA_ID=CAMNT_0023186567 /DNA_START=176 /DNA_END=2419 /DNA_ORIENTATION=+